MLVAASLEVAVQVYSTVDGMETGGVATVTELTAPGMTVTVLPPDLVEAETEVAVMVTVPDITPVNLAQVVEDMRVAEPGVPFALVQV